MLSVVMLINQIFFASCGSLAYKITPILFIHGREG